MFQPGMPHSPHLLENFQRLSGKVLIFGGTFDPVHLGHIGAAETAQLATGCETVLFVPNHQNPLKANAPIGSDSERLSLLVEAINGRRGWYVSPAQLDIGNSRELRSKVSYTIDLLREIISQAPSVQLHLLIGADQVETLSSWKEYGSLFSHAAVWVLGRNGVSSPADLCSARSTLSEQEQAHLRDRFIPFDQRISATEIRVALKSGRFERMLEWLSPQVAERVRAPGSSYTTR